MIKRKIIILAVTTLFVVISCKKEKPQPESKPVKKIQAIALENMDTSVKPVDDFFRYVNGIWVDNTKIPDEYPLWGGFHQLRKETDEDALSILKKAIKERNFPKVKDSEGKTIDSDQEKAVNYYESIMDTVSRNKQGRGPVNPYLAKIETIKTKKDIQSYITNMTPYGLNPFYGFYTHNDFKKSNINAGYLNVPNLSLSRDYYTDDKLKNKLDKFEKFVQKILIEFGDDATIAKKNASVIVAFEKSLAESMMTKEERRDPLKRYNPMNASELQNLTPYIHWKEHLAGIGIQNTSQLIITDKEYFKGMNAVLSNRSVDDIKLLLRWKLINNSLNNLTTELEVFGWEFYNKEMKGSKKQRPRDQRTLNRLNRAIGEALGKLYVKEKFPPEAKEKAKEMIDYVMLGFEKRIKQLPWMSEVTKTKALEKLHKLTVKIAYPDKWIDYSKLQIKNSKNGGNCFENDLNVAKWNFNRDIEKLGKEVDRTEWGMAPQTVNAYFNAVNNEIVFPAAILQPPFYNYKADEAVNYGGIGAVIGHEISHSFDDSGANFDGDGNLKDWWTEEDAKKFKEVSKKLIKQYSDIVAIDSTRLNGEFTLGENIGDLGGVQAAYEGLQIFINKKGRPKNIDGFTAEQRFFISWATIWRTKIRDEALKNRIIIDPHAPGMYRAYVPLKNVGAFYKAFNVKEGDKMYLKPEDRVRIW